MTTPVLPMKLMRISAKSQDSAVFDKMYAMTMKEEQGDDGDDN